MELPEPVIDLLALSISNYRRQWRSFMEKYNCQKICEVGVLEGENFEHMIAHTPLLAVAVDSWTDDGHIERHDSGFGQKVLDRQYKFFREKVANKPFVKIFRTYSVEAARNFANEYFDFVYIDADHTYQGCLADLIAWYPKVKKGKFLVGDDFRRGLTSKTRVKIGVKDSVIDFAKKMNIPYYELTGRGWVIIPR